MASDENTSSSRSCATSAYFSAWSSEIVTSAGRKPFPLVSQTQAWVGGGEAGLFLVQLVPEIARAIPTAHLLIV